MPHLPFHRRENPRKNQLKMDKDSRKEGRNGGGSNWCSRFRTSIWPVFTMILVLLAVWDDDGVRFRLGGSF